MKNICYCCLVFVVSSCSFNALFLHPTPLSLEQQPLKDFAGKNDSIFLFFSKENLQPTFTHMGKDTLELPLNIESVIYQSSNGHSLNGWFISSKSTKPSATLLHLHGNAGCLLSQYQAISPMLDHGFQLFLFDYSGFGFSEGKATKKNVLIDANATLDYVLSREDVKNLPLVLYGQSLGGHLAAVVASRRQVDIDGVVVEGAFSSHRDIAANMVPLLGRLFVNEQYAAKKEIKKLHKPVLVIHSSEDPVVPLFLGEKIYNSANQPKEFYEIEQCHMCGPSFYSMEIAEKIHTMLSL
jgi:uncharacterized protein